MAAEAEQRLGLVQFSDQVEEKLLHVQILQLQGQLYVWLGVDGRGEQNNLVAAFHHSKQATPVSTALLGGGAKDAEAVRRIA